MGALFVCSASRVVYTEKGTSLDTDAFLNALRKLQHFKAKSRSSDRTMERISWVFMGVKSELKGIGCDVPQGSVLSPLFFALYVDDIYRAISEDYFRLYADDTALFSWHSNLTTLTTEIKSKFTNLYNWCIANKLTTNEDEIKFMLFHTINKSVPIKCLYKKQHYGYRTGW